MINNEFWAAEFKLGTCENSSAKAQHLYPHDHPNDDFIKLRSSLVANAKLLKPYNIYSWNLSIEVLT